MGRVITFYASLITLVLALVGYAGFEAQSKNASQSMQTDMRTHRQKPDLMLYKINTFINDDAHHEQVR